MAKRLEPEELQQIFEILKEFVDPSITDKLKKHIEALEIERRDQEHRIRELASQLKTLRNAYIELQGETDQLKRSRNFFEDLSKDYGLITDFDFEDAPVEAEPVEEPEPLEEINENEDRRKSGRGNSNST
ncbi:MAG: hypothetical protein K9L68_10220 [Spirochaetales bacterium]|nr:hypothetical protein [Spirochaetales bacterium]MCF7938959.1 hypothetical protein [Spirochaetales bacterium]